MSQPTELADIQIDHNVGIPVRDGTRLAGELYRPPGDGPWPVIVKRNGYLPNDADYVAEGQSFSRHGYVFLFNSVRGAFDSEGVFNPQVDDGWGANQDGYDVIEWAARQPWSNGRVGMYGGSYGGFVQYRVAPTRPPSLKACFAVYSDSLGEFVFPKGMYRLHDHREWALSMAEEMARLAPRSLGPLPDELPLIRQRLAQAQAEMEQWLRHLPIKDFPPLAGLWPWFLEHLSHPGNDPWWNQLDARTQFGEIDVPMLHFGGWYDPYLTGTLDHYQGITAHGRSEHTRRSQRLVVTPTQHSHTLPPGLEFPADAVVDREAAALRWFDYWLKGIENGVAEEAPVRLFVMGENRWLEMEEWPPKAVVYTPIYLRQGSGPNGHSLNNGELTFDAPSGNQSVEQSGESYAYDPADPILSGLTFQEEIEGRMLTYTSAILSEPLRLIGPVTALIYASSSALDTDWVVRLCDVRPDGRSVKICDGGLRARLRNPGQAESLLEPGVVYPFAIDMTATAHTFLPGHRLRVAITSSDFPRLDRNLNTGGPFGEETHWLVAHNTIYHDATRPSHLLLPVVGGG